MMTTVFLKSMVRPTVSQPAIIDNLQEEVDNDNDREQRTGILQRRPCAALPANPFFLTSAAEVENLRAAGKFVKPAFES